MTRWALMPSFCLKHRHPPLVCIPPRTCTWQLPSPQPPIASSFSLSVIGPSPLQSDRRCGLRHSPFPIVSMIARIVTNATTPIKKIPNPSASMSVMGVSLKGLAGKCNGIICIPRNNPNPVNGMGEPRDKIAKRSVQPLILLAQGGGSSHEFDTGVSACAVSARSIKLIRDALQADGGAKNSALHWIFKIPTFRL